MTWNKISISKGSSNYNEVKADKTKVGWFKGGWFSKSWLADRQWGRVKKKESNWNKVNKE